PLRVETEDQSLPGAKPAPADLREREPAAGTVELLEPQHRVRLAAPGAGDLVELVLAGLLGRMVQEQESDVTEEAGAAHQLHELAGVLRRADPVGASRAETGRSGRRGE